MSSDVDGKVGVWLVGARGSVATTAAVGALSLRAGLAGTTGLVGALPEVAGGAAHLLPVDDPDAWVAGMIQMLDDGDERQRLVDAGRARVAGFTWRHTAACVLDAYRAAAATLPILAAGHPMRHHCHL